MKLKFFALLFIFKFGNSVGVENWPALNEKDGFIDRQYKFDYRQAQMLVDILSSRDCLIKREVQLKKTLRNLYRGYNGISGTYKAAVPDYSFLED